MIELNLLPEKVRAQETLRLILIVASVFWGVAVLGVAQQYHQAKAKVEDAERQVAQVQAELDAKDLKDAVLAVQKFTKDLAAAQAKASVVNQLRKDQVTIVRLLDTLPDWTMNDQVWFTNVEVKGDKGKRTVSLSGGTLSKATYAKFFTFLESQALVKGLSMDSMVNRTVQHGYTVYQFKVSFSIEEFG